MIEECAERDLQSMGRQVGLAAGERLNGVSFAAAEFGELASDALREAGGAATYQQFLQLLLHGTLPNQQDPNCIFGMPPVTIYQDPARRFYVDIYLWAGGSGLQDMAIHDHTFSGVFMVLDGICENLEYCWSESRAVGSNLTLGDLRPNSAEKLGPGDVRTIVAGEGFIHRNIHVSAPTLTIVLRTHNVIGSTAHVYHEGGIKVVPVALDPRQQRLIRAVSVGGAIGEFSVLDEVRALIRSGDDSADFALKLFSVLYRACALDGLSEQDRSALRQGYGADYCEAVELSLLPPGRS